MAMNHLQDLYVDQLRDLYSAETQIMQALPQMAEAATHPELRTGFQQHLEQTRQQVERLERIFTEMGESPRGHHCKGMEGLLAEGQELLQQRGRAKPDVLDAGLIATAQRVEHYEIAGYGTVRTYAHMLGRGAHAELLQQTLDEEGQTDHQLSALAERVVNLDAAQD